MRKIFILLILWNYFFIYAEDTWPVVKFGQKVGTTFSGKNQGGILKKCTETIYAGVNQKITSVLDISLKSSFLIGENYNSNINYDTYTALDIRNGVRIKSANFYGFSFFVSFVPVYTLYELLYSQSVSTGIVYKNDAFQFSASYTNAIKDFHDYPMNHTINTGIYIRSGKRIYNFHKILLTVKMKDVSLNDGKSIMAESFSCSYEYRIDLSDVFENIPDDSYFDE